MSDKISQPPARGRPKDPAKRIAILEAAKELFLRDGYVGTSMDAVAAEAGVSKLTVYSHFSDKANLFSAAVEAKSEEMLPSFALDEGHDIQVMLHQVGCAFVKVINSDEAVGLHRLMAAQAGQDNDMARLFFEAGPERMIQRMEKLLASYQSQEQLRLDDPAVAAEHFFGLLQGCHHMQVLIGCAEPPNEEEVSRRVASAVRVFLHGYAARD